MGKSSIASPAGIVKVVAVIFGIITLGLVVAARPGFLYRTSGYPYSLNLFFQMSVMTLAFAIVSLLANLLGATNNSRVHLVDTVAHILVGIWLIMYTTSAVEDSVNNYNDNVDMRCNSQDPTSLLSGGSSGTRGMQDEVEKLLNCRRDNPTSEYDACICELKVISKFNLTAAAFALGGITSLVHLAVGILSLKAVNIEK